MRASQIGEELNLARTDLVSLITGLIMERVSFTRFFGLKFRKLSVDNPARKENVHLLHLICL